MRPFHTSRWASWLLACAVLPGLALLLPRNERKSPRGQLPVPILQHESTGPALEARESGCSGRDPFSTAPDPVPYSRPEHEASPAQALARLRAAQRSEDPASLREAVYGDPLMPVRLVALERLVQLEGRNVRELLEALIADRRLAPALRYEAVRQLGVTGADAAPRLRELRNAQPDAVVRAGALAGLVAIPTGDGVHEVLSVAASPFGAPRSDVEQAFLRTAGHPGQVRALAAALDDAKMSAEARILACRALAQAGARSACEALMKTAGDSRLPAAVREEAVRALGRIGDPAALPILERLGGVPRGMDVPLARTARIAAQRIKALSGET